jgi:hypothetical protein
MPPARPVTFGRRGTPASGRAPLAVASPEAAGRPGPGEPAAPLEIARTLMREVRAEAPDPPSARAIAWSWRAAFLSGLAVACLQAGASVVAARGGIDLVPGLHIGTQGKASALVPLIIASGLWEGAENSATSLAISHFLLKRLGATSVRAYTLGGAAAGLFYAWLTTLIGGGDNAALLPTAAAGLAAGFFYRIFAGRAPK